MADRYDVVVIGMGPGGEVAAGRLLAAGRSVALVERELIGGECAYWACVPSKTLLRPPEARSSAARAAGTSRPELDWPALRDYRDTMIRHLDDTAQVEDYRSQGATVVKGVARLAGPGRVEVDGSLLEAEHVIVATGSASVRPPVEGLDEVEVWTNREATGLQAIPGRAVVLGGGAVGIELGQFLARMGSEVTVVQRGERLAGREDPPVGELALRLLAADGVDVRTGQEISRASRTADGCVVELGDGSRLEADVVVLGAGRTPRGRELGLETVGVEPTDRGAVPVDDRCRVSDGLWAVGDVTGTALFTHVAMYQGRVVADNILGTPRRATYVGIPRVIFCDPEIAAVGLTEEQAHDRGLDVVTTTVELPEVLARPWTYEQEPTGRLGVLVDRQRRVLLGAWAVAPLAGEWIHQAALAVRVEVPLDTLLDQVAQFPTYSESYLKALEQLDL